METNRHLDMAKEKEEMFEEGQTSFLLVRWLHWLQEIYDNPDEGIELSNPLIER